MKEIARIEIEGLPFTVNKIRRLYWRRVYEHNNLWKNLVYRECHFRQIIDLKLKKALLVFTRCSTYQSDFDNLTGSFKAVLDGLKMAGVILDDNPDVIGQPEYKWEKCKRKDQKIRIEIYNPSVRGRALRSEQSP